MEDINKKYNVEIEVLSPLSIGAGAEKDWVKGADFVIKDNRLYKLNLKKMVSKGFDLQRLTTFFANKDSEGIANLLGNSLEDVSDFNIYIPVISDNDIKAFVKNQLSGNPIIPGSSLKGAIRSILYQYLGGTSKDGREVFGSSTEGDEFMRFIKVSDAEFDSTTLVNTKIFNLQNTGDWKGGWKHSGSNTSSNFNPVGFNTLYESLLPKQKGYASLMMSEKLLNSFNLVLFYKQNIKSLREQLQAEVRKDKRIDLRKKIADKEKLQRTVSLKNNAIKIEYLFGIINSHTKDYLEKEKAFFQKYATDNTDLIIQSIDELLIQIPSDNSYCVLKMSAGSGFHSITGDWQFEDYTKAPLDRKRVEGKVNPKSRKIAVWNNHFSLMGFVKLRCLTIEEYKKIEQDRIKKRQEEELECQRKFEEEKLRREAEEKERQELEERNKQFNQLIDDIKKLIDNEKYEEASMKLQNVKENFPGYKQKVIDEEYLKLKVEEIQSLRLQQERQQQAEQEHLLAQKERAEGGLAKLLEEKYDFGPNGGNYKVTSFKVCANKVQSWLKAAALCQVPTEQQSALFETLIRLKSNANKKEMGIWTDKSSSIWQQISQFVGPDLAAQWFNEISI